MLPVMGRFDISEIQDEIIAIISVREHIEMNRTKGSHAPTEPFSVFVSLASHARLWKFARRSAPRPSRC